mgnify:CR=1 FL=1
MKAARVQALQTTDAVLWSHYVNMACSKEHAGLVCRLCKTASINIDVLCS